MSGPVVLKAEVAGLVHKTEAGAVKLGLHGEQEVRAAYRELAGTFGPGLAVCWSSRCSVAVPRC